MLFMSIQYAFVIYMVGLPTQINLTSLLRANHFYRPKGVLPALVCMFVCLQLPCYECTIHFDRLHMWVCPMHSVYCQCSNVIVLWKWVSFFVTTYEV